MKSLFASIWLNFKVWFLFKTNWRKYREKQVAEILPPYFVASKSIYSYDHPDNLMIFNSRLYADGVLIRKGDLDVTLEIEQLKNLARKLNKNLEVYQEFDKEEGKDYLVLVTSGGAVVVGSSIKKYFEINLAGQLTITKEHKKSIEESKNKDTGAVLKKSNIKSTIKLPDLNTFKGSKKEGSPWEQFQSYFIKKYKKEAANIYKKLYLTHDDYQILSKNSEKYAKKMFKGYHPAKIKQSLAMHELDFSCNKLSKECKWARSGLGHVRK